MDELLDRETDAPRVARRQPARGRIRRRPAPARDRTRRRRGCQHRRGPGRSHPDRTPPSGRARRSRPAGRGSARSARSARDARSRERARGCRPPTDRPASRTRHRSKPPSIGRIVLRAQRRRSRPGRGPRGGRDGAASRPDRAGRSARRARAGCVPIVTMLAIATRCCSPPESAKGSRSASGSIRRRAMTASIRASISVTRQPEVLETEGELLADGQLRAGELVRRGREDDADPAQERAAAGRVERQRADRRASRQPRPDDPRDEPRRDERQGRLAGPGPACDPDPLTGRDRQVELGQGGLAPSDIADRDPLEDEGRVGRPVGSCQRWRRIGRRRLIGRGRR